MQERDCDEVSVGTEAEAIDDSRPTASDESQTQTSAERRVTRSTVRQLQNKTKQKAESSTGPAHDSTRRMFNSILPSRVEVVFL